MTLYTRPNDLDSCRTNTSPVFSELNQSPVEFLGKIIKKYPYMKLIPNSLLAIAVLQEYNQIKGTTNRLPWPEDLCGYIENVNNLAQREAQLKADDILIINGIPDTQYDPDKCINQEVPDDDRFRDYITGEGSINTGAHLPGSVTYGNCEDGARNLIEDLYNVDWSSYFQNPSFPTLSEIDSETRDLINSNYEDLINQVNGAAAIAEAYPDGEPPLGRIRWYKTGKSPDPSVGWVNTGETRSRSGFTEYKWIYQGASAG